MVECTTKRKRCNVIEKSSCVLHSYFIFKLLFNPAPVQHVVYYGVYRIILPTVQLFNGFD